MRRSVLSITLLFLILLAGQVCAQGHEPTRPPGVININTASAEQLRLLPGIGPSRAARIVSFRSLKPFRRVLELARVKGIGRKTIRRLKAYLRVEGPTTLSSPPPRRL